MKNTLLILTLLLSSWISQCIAGGIVLERTRVIYDAGKRGSIAGGKSQREPALFIAVMGR